MKKEIVVLEKEFINRLCYTFLTLLVFSFVNGVVFAEEIKMPQLKEAIFAGGCFWCSEADFEKLPGIEAVISGYTGGKTENPTYEEVCSGKTGHYEAVKVVYDPAKMSYEKLLGYYWQSVDPTDEGGQFVDRGSQYRTAIFYFDAEQKSAAENSKQKLSQSGRYDRPIVTPILKAAPFYAAEEHHQGYYKTNPNRYKLYRYHSGRDQYLDKVWSEKKEN